MKSTKYTALLSLLGFVFFIIITIVLHFLRTDKNIFTSFVSEYAVGNYGWLMTIAFYCITTGATLLLIGLIKDTKATQKSIFLMGIFCIGFLLLSIFRTDVPVRTLSPHGLIHALAAIASLLSLGISMITWSAVFKRDDFWKHLAKPSLIFGISSLILLVVHIASPEAWLGVTQRFLIFWDVCWLILISTTLYRNASLKEI